LSGAEVVVTSEYKVLGITISIRAAMDRNRNETICFESRKPFSFVRGQVYEPERFANLGNDDLAKKANEI
jgi:hypothetical protein